MALIVPTITAQDETAYKEQIDRIQHAGRHIHLDLMDGAFAPSKSLNVEHLWIPDDITCDVHIMYQHPEMIIDELKKLSVRLIIVHAESAVHFRDLKKRLKESDIQIGVSLLPATSVNDAQEYIQEADHVLIFSGNLGYQGGSKADLSLLERVHAIKAINSSVEIGWDGGVNDQNVKQIAEAGIDIINVGGFIHHADRPTENYRLLQQIVG